MYQHSNSERKTQKVVECKHVRYLSPTKHLSPKYEVDEVTKVVNRYCHVPKDDFNCKF